MARYPALAVAMLAAIALASPGCTQLRQFGRFFLSRCPEKGPRQEEEFNVHLERVTLDRYYDDLAAAAGEIPARVAAHVDDGGARHAIYHFGPVGAETATPLLIVAGMHGNEMAGSLAAPAILEEIRSTPADYRSVRIHVVAPANPVGLRHGSRYNLDGCDINRDFQTFGTTEARVIRDVVAEVRPRLMLSLHEGPHAGFFVIATRNLPEEMARAAVADVAIGAMALATENNLGWRLKTPGVMKEGWFVTGAKNLFGINSFGAYGEKHGVPVLTTEGPWSSPDLPARVRAQVLAVRGVARYLATTSAEPPVERKYPGGCARDRVGDISPKRNTPPRVTDAASYNLTSGRRIARRTGSSRRSAPRRGQSRWARAGVADRESDRPLGPSAPLPL